MPIEPFQLDVEEGLQRLADPATKAALQSDAELLELYLYGGRQDAIATLIQRFAPLVTSVIRRVVSHPQDAEDAFQATFLILLKSAKNIRSRPSIAAWLYGVAYRTACRVRSKSRRQAQPLGEADMPATAAEQNPVVELARQIELGNLDRELENLPETLREPLTEHYIFGYTARQIADRMELSVSAVEGRLRRGRRLLRRRLAVRGTSLTVVVAGAAWLRDHASTASASEQWTTHLLESPIFDPDASAGVNLSCDPYLSELVQGESTMHFAPFLKSASFLGAAAFATVSMSVIAVAMQLGPVPKGGGSAATQIERTEAESEEPATEVTIEVAGSAEVGPRAAETAKTTQAYDFRVVDSYSPDDPTAFVRPEGETPNWLRAGSEDLSSSEEMRDMLRQTVKVSFDGLPFRQVLEALLAQNGLPYHLNEVELDNLSIDPDTPITNNVGEVLLCDALELILKPLDLQYEVYPQYVKISSNDELQGAVRYYDLAFILPTSAGVPDLIRAIESTTTDEEWNMAGGSSISVVGSMMVANCSEKAHRQIEKLLARLAKVDPKNLRAPGYSNMPAGGMGGGGMGGGGMF